MFKTLSSNGIGHNPQHKVTKWEKEIIKVVDKIREIEGREVNGETPD